MDSRSKLTVYYDGGCAFCRRCVSWLQRQNPSDFECTPFDPRADLSGGIEVVESTTGIHFFREKAVAACLRKIPRYAWLGRILSTIPLCWIAAIVYRWVATNRKLISRWFCRSGTCH